MRQDYITVVKKDGRQTFIDYIVTLDMAKELCMENVDYITLHKKVERQILIEYIITLDTAKHLSYIYLSIGSANNHFKAYRSH